MVTIRFKLLDSSAKIPTFARPGDAAFDIYSVEKLRIPKGKCRPVKTGVASEFPQGYFVSFRGRSGLAFKNGIDVLGGVIDPTYRGEWMIMLANLGEKACVLEKGERIAQGLLQPLPKVKIQQVKKLTDTVRGEKGFGSSGRI
jgi:dUTP pyrophosphatase